MIFMPILARSPSLKIGFNGAVVALLNVHVMTKKAFIFSLATLLISISYAAVAQQTERVKSLLNLEEDKYFINRDSAFADPYDGLAKLVYGNKRFADGRSVMPRRTDEVLEASARGQTPFATIIGCSDSRVPNEIVFDQGVGDLFVTRTAGQVMAEASYGTIEYSTEVLNTKLIVVLGHEMCGAVDAAMKLPKDAPAHVVTLINAIKPAAMVAYDRSDDPKERLDIAIRENVMRQVEVLRSLEPILSDRFNQGDILIVGAVYDINTGYVKFIEESITSLPKFQVVESKNSKDE